MAKLTRLVNGVLRTVTVDFEEAITVSTTSKSVSFPANLQTANASPRVNAWMINTTDANPTFQPVEITARSAAGFTAKWNDPVDSGNYILAYNVPDGWIS